ncbi:Hypothetical predicted protein [Octopus vulgaris]|uniref:Uncharacterized protein n=1 Tax=Octopus vulgaris TaxID=6645 RepID=A0AA36FA29_OCTVU|nr:Hypothetical predicted protein [Octopus vulgaris]
MVDTNTINQIASSADRIMEFFYRPTAADSVSASSSRQQPDNKNGDTMLKAIDGLTRQIAQFCRVRRCSRSSSFSSRRRNSFSTNNSPQKIHYMTLPAYFELAKKKAGEIVCRYDEQLHHRTLRKRTRKAWIAGFEIETKQ